MEQLKHLSTKLKVSIMGGLPLIGGGKSDLSNSLLGRILFFLFCCLFSNNLFAQSDWRTIQDFESLTSSDVKACYSSNIKSSSVEASDVKEYSGAESIFTDNAVTASISEDGVGTNSTKVAKLSKTKDDNNYSYGIVFSVSLGSNKLSDYKKIKLDTYTDDKDDPLCVYVRKSGTNSFKQLFVLGNGFGPSNEWATMGYPDCHGQIQELQITTTGMDYSDVEFYIGYTQSYGSQNVYIDNIQLYGPAIGTVKIKEGESNTITAKEHATVELYRSLTANTWNTICLPFAPKQAHVDAIFGVGAKFAQFSSVSNGVMQFTSVDVKDLQAGTPYLVLPSQSQTASSPIELTDVNIEATNAGYVTIGDYTFQGIYSPKSFTINDQTIRFVAAGNKLKYPNTDKPLKALRAYFILPVASPAKDYFYDVDSFVPTSIANIQIEGDGDGAIYNIGGQRVEGKSLPKGIYIKEGKKFVVK